MRRDRSGRPEGFPYLDLFPEAEGRRASPMDAGGRGRWFVYVSNRNHCTWLFDPVPLHELYDLLCREIPMGYAQLFVLEKADRGRTPAGTGDERWVVFQDPGRTHVGGGAPVSKHESFVEASKAAAAHRERTGVHAVVARIVAEYSWH